MLILTTVNRIDRVQSMLSYDNLNNRVGKLGLVSYNAVSTMFNKGPIFNDLPDLKGTTNGKLTRRPDPHHLIGEHM